MSKDMHWIPLFHRDLVAATAAWTDEEFGAYVRLLIHQWDHGRIPIDLDRIRRIALSAPEHWDLLGPKFPDGVNPRMADERRKANEIREKRSENGRIGAAVKWSTDGRANSRANGPANGKQHGKRHGKTMPSTVTVTYTGTAVPESSLATDALGASESATAPVATTRRAPRSRHHAAVTWSPESGWSQIPEAIREVWRKAYPACDIDRELAAMTAWLIGNPARAKKYNWVRFIVGWLTKSQDKGGDTPSNRAHTNGYTNPAAEERRAKQRATEFPEDLKLPVVRISG